MARLAFTLLCVPLYMCGLFSLLFCWWMVCVCVCARTTVNSVFRPTKKISFVTSLQTADAVVLVSTQTKCLARCRDAQPLHTKLCCRYISLSEYVGYIEYGVRGVVGIYFIYMLMMRVRVDIIVVTIIAVANVENDHEPWLLATATIQYAKRYKIKIVMVFTWQAYTQHALDIILSVHLVFSRSFHVRVRYRAWDFIRTKHTLSAIHHIRRHHTWPTGHRHTVSAVTCVSHPYVYYTTDRQRL